MPRKKQAAQKAEKTQVDHQGTVEYRDRLVLVDKAKMQRVKSDLNPEAPDVMEQAAHLVRSEKLKYDEANRLVKETMKRAYKNYLGVFDEPYDPYTNRKKVFTPLTHNIVDSVAKPVNVTARSIRITPVNAESRGAAKLLNMALPYFFQQMGFDDMMKKLVHRTAWLGTQITVQDWLYEKKEVPTDASPTEEDMNGFPKQEKYSDKTKTVKEDRPRIRLVNPMDLFLPATAESVSWAVRNASAILRSVVPVTDIQGNSRYDEKVRAELQGNTFQTEDMNDSSAFNKYAQSGYSNESRQSSGLPSASTSVPMATVYSRFGKIPKSWITKKDGDAMTLVDGIIECAGDSSDGKNFRTLCVRLSPFGDYGPFEECRYNVLPNRYFGEGIGERLIPLQAWQNEVVNVRRNNEVLVQHRMFVYRKGSVDTRQFFARPGGGIAVENMGDVQALEVGDVKQSSFTEDQNIESAAMRLAGASTTPISKKITATESAGIQAAANVTYSELKDTVEKYMERLVLKHILPLLKQFYRSKKNIPIDIPVSDLEAMATYSGYAPQTAKGLAREVFLYTDDPRMFDGDFMVTVDIDESGTSKPQQVNALMGMVTLASKIQNSGVNIQAAFRKMFELQGVVDDRLFEEAQAAVPTGVTNPNGMPAAPVPTGPAPMPTAPQTPFPV